MNLPKPFSHYFKYIVVAVYLVFVAWVSWYKHSNDLSVRDMALIIKLIVQQAGLLGPFVILFFYFVQIFIPFPTAGVAVISGAIYGPWWGILLVYLGLNLSGAASFWLGRYFGRHIIEERERGWLKKYDDKLKDRGFFTVLFMRLFQFPFDFVSLGAGMTQMSFRQFVIGTALGVIPSTVTFVTLGNSFRHPGSWILFGSLFFVTLGISLLMRYSPWGVEFMKEKPKNKLPLSKDE